MKDSPLDSQTLWGLVIDSRDRGPFFELMLGFVYMGVGPLFLKDLLRVSVGI